MCIMIGLVLCTLIFINISFMFLKYYLKVRKINKETVKIIRQKTKDRVHPFVEHLNFSSSFKNSLKNPLLNIAKKVSLGGTFAGMSILDIYTATNKHKEILKTIAERFPNEMKDASMFDWIKKFKKLENNNTSFSYKNAFTGEKAEIESINTLKELGYKEVSQFESRTHPDNDLTAIDSEGNEVHFSVKSHANSSLFHKEVAEHPDSKNYVVNSELYQDMETSGHLTDYESEGIRIVDGKFSHTKSVQEFENAFEDVKESVDVSDDISVIACAILAYKTSKNVFSFIQGKQSKKELGINVTMDTAGTVTQAATAAGGAKIGAGIGTAIVPGLGTAVGVIGGAIGTAFLANPYISSIIKSIKESWKWGDIIEAIDHYGEIYQPVFMNLNKINFNRQNVFKKIYKAVYNNPQVLENLKKEKTMYMNNSNFFERWGLIPRNIKAALILEHIKSLKKYLKNTKPAIKKFFNEFQKELKNITSTLPEQERETTINRIVGEFVIENKGIFIEKKSTEEKELLKGYRLQKKECPNHPYKISDDSNKYFKHILWKNLKEISI